MGSDTHRNTRCLCVWDHFLDAEGVGSMHAATSPSQRQNAKKHYTQQALCVTAERLEGSPPPELPNYACDCASDRITCKYTFRNSEVIPGNQWLVTQPIQKTALSTNDLW